MTNVPEPVRNALADAYKLFDVSYQMNGTEAEWEQYWNRGCELIKKYGDELPLLNLIEGYAKIIESAVNERKTGNKSLMWNSGEAYPHPKE